MRHDSPLNETGSPRGGRILLQTVTLSSSQGTVDLDFPVTPYSRFQVEIDNIASTGTEVVLWCRFGIQGAFPAGTDDYQFASRSFYASGGPSDHRSSEPGTGYIAMCDQDNSIRYGNTDPFMCGSYSIDVDPGNDTNRHPQMWYQGGLWSDSPQQVTSYGGGMYIGATLGVDERADGIQFLFSADSIARGTFRLYGTE
jgi:hypothetical protein